MPTVSIEGEFRFVVNTRENEFEPPHVHVLVANEDVCRIELNSGQFMDEPPPGDRRILDAYRNHADAIKKARDEIHRSWANVAKATVLVKNADRMITAAIPRKMGIALTFADGRRGLVPFEDLPEIKNRSNLESIEVPNPYEVVLRSSRGDTVEIPWDFARHYCDSSYRPRVEAIAARGRESVGDRIRRLRTASGMTQGELASRAGIGRVTLVRIEKGEQSPRYETLMALSRALGVLPGELLLTDFAS